VSVSGRVKSVDSCRCRRRCSVPCEDGKLKIIDGPMRSISDYSAENRIFNEAALRVVSKLLHVARDHGRRTNERRIVKYQ
jgi:hypothetical protein